MTVMLALPALALRDPKLRGYLLGGNPKFSVLFMLLGTIAIPLWVPYVGVLVVTFTVAIPSEPGVRKAGFATEQSFLFRWVAAPFQADGWRRPN